MSDGNRPSVGFFFFFVFFSLGHSSVVCALAFVFDINTLGFIIAGMAL